MIIVQKCAWNVENSYYYEQASAVNNPLGVDIPIIT